MSHVTRVLKGKKYNWDNRQRPLHSYVEKRRCAQCWNQVLDRQKEDGTWEIYCPRGCQPGGHVSEAWVEIQQSKDRMNAEQVANAYPDLRGAEEFVYKEREAEELEELIGVLWPE